MSNARPEQLRPLPERPSVEYLRKEAKRRARALSITLAAAQRELAREYGFPNWAELLRQVRRIASEPRALSPLAEAARAADEATVKELLAAGEPVNGGLGDEATPLRHVCASQSGDEQRLKVAELLLEAGADPGEGGRNGPPLHAAAAHGPLAMVELLIRHGALEWQIDHKGRSPVAAAKRGSATDKAEIVALLDRPVIRDPLVRRALSAVRKGDVAALEALLDAKPRLLRERIREPECYRAARRHQYFLDPKLFWFVANNLRWMKRMPPNIVAVAEAMIARGVDKSDLDYALELVMTSASARAEGHQLPLMRIILEAGGAPSQAGIDMALAHGELDPVRALLDLGWPMTASIAAALGDADRLQSMLRAGSDAERQSALAMAVINRRPAAVAAALEAGADPNRFMPVHSHSVPLHQAALHEDIPIMEMLVSHGARTEIRDRLWKGTPLNWASHEGKARAQAWLESNATGAA